MRTYRGCIGACDLVLEIAQIMLNMLQSYEPAVNEFLAQNVKGAPLPQKRRPFPIISP
jgi:hypothetical protein